MHEGYNGRSAVRTPDFKTLIRPFSYVISMGASNWAWVGVIWQFKRLTFDPVTHHPPQQALWTLSSICSAVTRPWVIRCSQSQRPIWSRDMVYDAVRWAWVTTSAPPTSAAISYDQRMTLTFDPVSHGGGRSLTENPAQKSAEFSTVT